MKIRSMSVGIVMAAAGILAAGANSAAFAAKQQAAAPAAAAEAKGSKDTCLSCHGPFEKIIENSANYTAPSGEKISPHRFVPHDSKKDEDVPECTNCHTAHALDPLPAAGSVDLSKVKVQWCYTACHHEKNFTSCKECH